ncbi:MAG: tetratricopeptide repeat protein, partial [Gemmatimonadetes bacterium]|nr:tetratricopeptide repeat protein [Gemmatimonadota bacterium]
MIKWVSFALGVALVAGCGSEPEVPPAKPAVQPPPVEDPLLIGRALLRQKRYADALAVYGEARKRHPQSGEVLATLGRIHLALGQPEEATQFYEMAVALESDQPEWLVALGNVHLKLNRYDEAHAAF